MVQAQTASSVMTLPMKGGPADCPGFEQRRTHLQQLLLRAQDQLPGREGFAAGLGRAGDMAAAAPRAGVRIQQLLPGEVPDLRLPDRGGVVQIHRPQGPLGGQVPGGDVGEDEDRVEMFGAGRVDDGGEQYQVVEPPETVEHRRQAACGDTGVLEGARQGHADGWPGILDTARGIAEALEKIVQHHHGDHDREEYGLDDLLAPGLVPLQPRRFDDVAFDDGPDHAEEDEYPHDLHDREERPLESAAAHDGEEAETCSQADEHDVTDDEDDEPPEHERVAQRGQVTSREVLQVAPLAEGNGQHPG